MQIECRSFELVRKLIPKCSLSYPKIRSKLRAIQRACSICIAETQPALSKDIKLRAIQRACSICIAETSLPYRKIKMPYTKFQFMRQDLMHALARFSSGYFFNCLFITNPCPEELYLKSRSQSKGHKVLSSTITQRSLSN